MHCTYTGAAELLNELDKLAEVFVGDINPLKPELNSICYLLALLGAHHFLHVSRIRVKLLTFRLLMSYIYDISHLRVNGREYKETDCNGNFTKHGKDRLV